MIVQSVGPTPSGGFRRLLLDRRGFQQAFADLVLQDPGLAGRILNIGCSGQMDPAWARIAAASPTGQMDGVDPDPAVIRHPALMQRWHGLMEDADIPSAAYDLAYAYNVVEHVSDARRFFACVHRVLKPGATFWGLTPHGHHPFCKITRLVETLGLKRQAAKRNAHVNQYPSYYRLNTASQILRATEGIGFAVVRFYYLPSVQWDTYFPSRFRWAPHMYDFLIGTRFRWSSLVFAFSLQAEKA